MKEDSQLIEASLGGDSQSFEQLVCKYQNRLYNAMVHVVGCRVEAEDVCQEAFVQSYLKLSTYQAKSPFFGWLYRIAFNLSMTRLRKKKVEVSIEAAREAAGVEPFDPTENAEGKVFREERAQQVHEALQELSEEFRHVVVLRELEGHSYEEIADMLDMPIGTVRSRIHRGRSIMREKLKLMLRESLDG